MKDTREIENYEEEKPVQKTSWLSCVFMGLWDCLKAMGKGFEYDNKNTCQRSRFRR